MEHGGGGWTGGTRGRTTRIRSTSWSSAAAAAAVVVRTGHVELDREGRAETGQSVSRVSQWGQKQHRRRRRRHEQEKLGGVLRGRRRVRSHVGPASGAERGTGPCSRDRHPPSPLRPPSVLPPSSLRMSDDRFGCLFSRFVGEAGTHARSSASRLRARQNQSSLTYARACR